jgi:hypothetical protein
VAGSFGGGGAPGGAGGGPGGTGGGFGTGTGTGTGTGGTGTGSTGSTGTGTAPGKTGGTSGSTGGPTGRTTGSAGTGTPPSGTGGIPGGSTSTGTGSTGTGSTGTGSTGTGSTGTGSTSTRTGGPGAAGDGAGGFGGAGGLSGNTQVSSALIKLLETDASKYKWVAATEGSQSAAPIELATGGDAVLAIGGFNGTDPTPTLAQFEAMVAKGEIHYYVGESSNSFGGGSGSSSIASWVAAHFKSETVGGTTVYDLTQAK